MLVTFIKGFATGGSLIIAIGAQNAFVLSQGIRKNYIVLIPLICCICDALFISLGVSGVGSLASSMDILKNTIAFLGSSFLFFYGFNSFVSAYRGTKIEEDHEKEESLKKVVLATLGVTLLNPHFYIDTLFLVGSISSGIDENLRIFFGAGAVTASIIWFFSLSIGASFLRPLFQKEISWRILDSIIGITMWAIGFSLLKTML